MAASAPADVPRRVGTVSAVIDLSLIATVGFWLVWRSWRKWTHPVIDFGRELYVPWRMSLGESLYADLAYFNGPLSPHLNALAFRLFGVDLSTLLVLNVAITAAVVVVLYLLSRKIGGRLEAIVAAVIFLLVFATADLIGFGNYNFMTPYSHEMTHATLLGLALLWALYRYLDRPSALRLLSCSSLLGLMFLTKAEFFVAAAAALSVALAIDSPARRRLRQRPARSAMALAGGALAAPIVSWCLLAWRIGPREGAIGILGSWPYLFLSELSQLPFYRQGMGLDEPVTSVTKMLVWAAIYCVALAPALIVAGRHARRSRSASIGCSLTVLWSPVALIGAGVWFDPTDFPRPLPLVVAVAGIAMFRVIRRGGLEDPERPRRIAFVALAIFSLVLLAKMALHVRYQHYGFALALPATVALVVALLSLIPDAVRRRGGNGTVFRTAGLLFLCVVGIGFSLPSQAAFRQKTLAFGLGVDRVQAHPRFLVMQQLVDRLGTEIGNDETVLVLPEGIMFNYQIRRPTPTRYLNFMPPEFVMFGEDSMLAALTASPPDVVVLIKRSTHEYGYEAFGSGYGEAMLQWLDDKGFRVIETLTHPRLDAHEFGRALILRAGPAAE